MPQPSTTLNSSRFLFFLYYYPPQASTASKRNQLISSEIQKRISFSKIFTSSHNKPESNDSGNNDVEYITTYDYRYFLKKKSKEGSLREEQKESKAMQFLVKFINTFPLSIIIGEGGLVYFLSMVRKGHRAIRENNITHIYSSFRPFADHYAAYILKRRNPELYWIADFRDLIIDPHYNHIFFSAGQRSFLKRIFRYANLLTTVSNGLAEHLKEYNGNVITLRNGIKNIPDQLTPQHCKYFKIAYTGSMFLDKRNPEPLFIALNELISDNLIKRDEARIVYAGKDSSYWSELAGKYELDAIFVDKGIVLYEESVAIQKSACINLLLTISSAQLQGVLTGKMIEYFESGSPILAIVVNQKDPELSRILDELEIGRSFSDQKKDYEGIKEFVYNEYVHWKNTGMNRKPVDLDQLRKKYSIEKTMRPLFEKIFSP